MSVPVKIEGIKVTNECKVQHCESFVCVWKRERECMFVDACVCEVREKGRKKEWDWERKNEKENGKEKEIE